MDLKLLRLLDALFSTGSVSDAARTLGLAPATLVRHLARLRALTGARLVVKAGGEFRLAASSHEILPFVREAIAAMEKIASGPPPFDPTLSRRTFRLAVPDSLDPDYLPTLLSRLRHEAPHTQLDVLMLTEDHDFIGGLESGEVDAVIGNWPSTPTHLRKAHLYDDPVVCLTSPSTLRQLGGQLTSAAYLDASHIAISPYGGWQVGPLEHQFRLLKLDRRVAVTVPRCSLVPGILARDPLLFTTGARFARFWAAAFDLTVLPCPVPLGCLRYHQLWHERGQSSAATRWLLSRCEETARRRTRPVAAEHDH